MPDEKKKVVKLPSGEVIAFPGSMPDAHVAGLITAFRQGKFSSPQSGQVHTGNLHTQVSPKTTENSEHLRQSGDTTPQLPAPSWNELRQYVNDKTQPTILPPLQGKLNYSQSAQDINARANNFTQNSMKRAGRFLFGVADMVPQTASTLVNLFSSDPKVSQQAESDLLSMHPGAQISDRGKELVEDWKKSPALAGSNLTGDALGFYLAGRMGPHDVSAVPLDKEPPRFRTRRVYSGPMGDVRVGTDNIPTVWMHPKAWESLMDVLYPGEDAGNTHGMSLGADENLLKLARDKGVSQRPEFKEVQTMLEKAHAAAQGSSDSVAVGVKRGRGIQHAVRLMREERNHAYQRSLSQNKRIMTHLSPEGFTEVAKSIPGTMSAHLQFEGYDPQSAPEMVSEAAARMIGGELRGATPEQAGEFLDKYFQQIVKEHGPKALETLEHVRGEGAKAKERINAEHNASEQGATRTGVPEVATGRQGGAGATPNGTTDFSREGKTARLQTQSTSGNFDIQGPTADDQREVALNRERPESGNSYEQLSRLRINSDLGQENTAALVTPKGKVLVGDWHTELYKESGYGDKHGEERFFKEGGVRIRAQNNESHIEFSQIDPATVERVTNAIQALPGREVTLEYMPLGLGKGTLFSLGDKTRALSDLSMWARRGDRSAPQYGSAAYWHQQGDAAFSREQEKTPEFKNWFKDSKIVDEKGDPRVVYHGTNRGKFSSFSSNVNPRYSENTAKLGFFFTDSPDLASAFAKGRKGRVMPVYLSIENPKIEEAQARSGLSLTDEIENHWNEDEVDEYIREVKAAGHDGIIFKGLFDNGDPFSEYVAFAPEQIKSATGNRGDFDASKSDITMNRNRVADLREDVPTPSVVSTGSTKTIWSTSGIGALKNQVLQQSPHKVEAPDGKTYVFPNLDSLNNFRNEAGIK